MDTKSPMADPQSERSDCIAITDKYQQPDLIRSVWQLFNSIVPFVVIWYLMYRSLEISYLITLLLAIPAAGFLVRIFIIFHDCGHGSFFKSKRANQIVGFVTGVMTLSPFHQWSHDHAVHHATAGDLDRRGVGDIWTMTANEYQASGLWQRFWYRIYRNPVFMLGFGGIFLFLIKNRFPSKGARRREFYSVIWTNVAIAALIVVLGFSVGFINLLLVHAPLMFLASIAGIWLFYVQHQFETVYWDNSTEWSFVKAALDGSSFYKLPRILQWFTGNIGFHHIHHLSPRIPNYKLEKCHRENSVFQQTPPITLLKSLESLRFRVWDEDSKKLISFRHLQQAQP